MPTSRKRHFLTGTNPGFTVGGIFTNWNLELQLTCDLRRREQKPSNHCTGLEACSAEKKN